MRGALFSRLTLDNTSHRSCGEKLLAQRLITWERVCNSPDVCCRMLEMLTRCFLIISAAVEVPCRRVYAPKLPLELKRFQKCQDLLLCFHKGRKLNEPRGSPFG